MFENTAAQVAAEEPKSFEGYIGNTPFLSPETDPNAVRWAFNPVSSNVFANPRQLGFGGSVPYFEPFALISFQLPIENCTTDENAPRSITSTITAQEVELTLWEMFKNRGFVVFSKGELNERKMKAVGRALTPPLKELGIVCPMTDELDLGDREHCPMCHYEYLVSDECRARIPEQAKLIGLSAKELEDFRALFAKSVAEYIKSAREEWRQIRADIEGGKQLPLVSDLQHAIRKGIHEVKPEDKQLELAAQFAKAQGDSQNEGLAAVLQVLQEQNQQNQQNMMQFMATILQEFKNGNAAVAQPETPAAPATEEKKKGSK